MKLAMVEETVLSCDHLKDNDDLLKFYTGTFKLKFCMHVNR